MKTGAVIVAAGMSTRMSDFKQLMKIGDLSLIERVVLNFIRAGVKDIVMVTGYKADSVEKSLRNYGITFLRNENYETTEMFDSAKLGLEYLQNRCDRILFCPGDVPFFSDETVETILKAEGDLIFPIHDGRIGHPISIAASLVPEILNHDGDRGLKGALDKLNLEPVRILVDDEGAVTDADTPEDFKHLVDIYDRHLTRPAVKVWFAKYRSFFGPGTVTILKQIDALGSVREACKKTGISYSKGWSIIHAAEEQLGYVVVERKAGGKNGGAACVSEKGRALLELFEEYERRVNEAAKNIYDEMFSDCDLLSGVNETTEDRQGRS